MATLVRFLLDGSPTAEMVANMVMSFTDVPENHWAFDYVLMAAHGYIALPVVPDDPDDADDNGDDNGDDDDDDEDND